MKNYTNKFNISLRNAFVFALLSFLTTSNVTLAFSGLGYSNAGSSSYSPSSSGFSNLGYSNSGSSSYRPSSGSSFSNLGYSNLGSSSYRPSSSGFSNLGYSNLGSSGYTPISSFSNLGYSNSGSYRPSSSFSNLGYSNLASGNYTPISSFGTSNSNLGRSTYTPIGGCTGSNCTGGYSRVGSNGYSTYTPSYGCSGSNCGGSAPSGGSMSALGLNLNYSDNDTTIIDNSRTNNSVRINTRSSSTTNNINTSCSNVNSASSTGNCNTTTNTVYYASRDDDNNDELEIICRVSDTSIEEGDTVTYTVEINGGRSSYRIEWDGDISGDDDEERVRYNRSGTYRVSVEVRDANGDRASDDCASVRVRDEDDEDDDDDDDRRVTVTTGTNLNTPNGNLAGLESVFLSQVPYTGPGDVAKALGVVALVAVWSTAIALYLKKQRAVKSVSNKIANFKEQNKNANKIA